MQVTPGSKSGIGGEDMGMGKGKEGGGKDGVPVSGFGQFNYV
jgi:hypothetical protein